MHAASLPCLSFLKAVGKEVGLLFVSQGVREHRGKKQSEEQNEVDPEAAPPKHYYIASARLSICVNCHIFQKKLIVLSQLWHVAKMENKCNRLNDCHPHHPTTFKYLAHHF